MLLDVKNLSISFATRKGQFKAVRNLSFELNEGEILGIVGESGCGKSLCNLALMGLLPENASMQAKTLQFMGHDLLKMPESQRKKLRGNDMTMIFQDPTSSLNPCLTVAQQIMETIAAHQGGTKKEQREQSIELLEQMGVPDPKKRMDSYPHELSGGMCQRVMMAQAIACHPKLLIADEPTTALDVTIQSQILDLLLLIRQSRQMAIIFVTHDIGVVANISDRIQVMYAGEIVESGTTQDVIQNPAHPYTEGLFKSLPGYDGQQDELYSFPGTVPNLSQRPQGCQFHPRCSYRQKLCEEQNPNTITQGGHSCKCLTPRGELYETH